MARQDRAAELGCGRQRGRRRAASRRRRLPPSPRRRGQRRRASQEPAGPPPGDRPRHRRPPRPRPLAAGLLLRVRRRPPEAAGDQGDRRVRGGAIPERRDAETIGGLLRFQSVACGYVGSPLYEDLLARAADDYERGGPTRRVLEGHEKDPKDSALALRLMGAVHRLALTGRAPALARRYAAADGDGERTWEAFRATLEDRVDELRPLVERPVQTNEVGRCAALLPGFLDVAARTGKPLRMLEVGASAGLNLGWSEYRYQAGDFVWGPPRSALRIDFELLGGGGPAAVPATVAERAGCDASPVDPASEEGRLALLSYAWPAEVAGMARLRAALEFAAGSPAPVERGGAVEWAA